MRYVFLAVACALVLFCTVSCVESGKTVIKDEAPPQTVKSQAAALPSPDEAGTAEASENKAELYAGSEQERGAAAAGEGVPSGPGGAGRTAGPGGERGGPVGQPSGERSGSPVTTVPVYVEAPGAAAKTAVTEPDTEEPSDEDAAGEEDAVEEGGISDEDTVAEEDASGEDGTTDEETEEETDNEYVDGLIEDGDYYSNNGNSARAAGYYQQAINADPDNQTALSRLNGLIEVVTMFGQPEEVGMVMKELIIYAPENAYYRYMYGRYMMSVGFVNEAYESLELATYIEPGNPVYVTEFGNSKLFRGDYAGALVDFESAIALNPSYNMAYVKKAYVFIKTGSDAEGREILDGVLVRGASSFDASFAYALLGDKPAMMEQLGQVMAVEPQMKWFIYNALEFEAYRTDPDFVEALNSF